MQSLTEACLVEKIAAKTQKLLFYLRKGKGPVVYHRSFINLVTIYTHPKGALST